MMALELTFAKGTHHFGDVKMLVCSMLLSLRVDSFLFLFLFSISFPVVDFWFHAVVVREDA